MPMVRRHGHDLELPMLLPPIADGRNDEPPATSDAWRRSAEAAVAHNNSILCITGHATHALAAHVHTSCTRAGNLNLQSADASGLQACSVSSRDIRRNRSTCRCPHCRPTAKNCIRRKDMLYTTVRVYDVTLGVIRIQVMEENGRKVRH